MKINIPFDTEGCIYCGKKDELKSCLQCDELGSCVMEEFWAIVSPIRMGENR